VTPVRAGPRLVDGSCSLDTVHCPTRTPGTSVMALSGPLGSAPMLMPRERARALGGPVTADGEVPWSAGRMPRSDLGVEQTLAM
jgi:hypothetical protein